MDLHISSNNTAVEPSFSTRTVTRSYDRWLVCALFVVFFFPTLSWLGVRWAEGDSYGHGFLVVPLVLLFVHRAFLGQSQPPSRLVAFQAALAVLSVAWAFGYMSNVQVVQDALLPLLLLAAFAGLYGWPGLRAMVLPVTLFVLAIPVWDYVVLPLQLVTANVAELMLIVADVPVLVEGDLVHVANGTFQIAGGCAGIRYVLVATILTITYGQLYLGSVNARMRLILAGLAMALVVNWIRVALVVVVGNAVGLDHPLVVDHAWLGWLLFAIALVPLFLYARRLEESDAAEAPRAALGGRGAERNALGGASVTSLLLVVAAMGLGPAWALTASLAPGAAADLDLPGPTSRWEGPLPNESSWQPRFVGADAERSGVYRSGGDGVYLYANVYVRQSQTAELVGNENSVIGDWSSVDDLAPSPQAWPEPVAVVTARSKTGPLWLVWYWYDVGGHRTASDLAAKVYQGTLGLVGERRAGIIALATECSADCADAAARLEVFVADVQPSLPDLLVPSHIDEESNYVRD